MSMYTILVLVAMATCLVMADTSRDEYHEKFFNPLHDTRPIASFSNRVRGMARHFNMEGKIPAIRRRFGHMFDNLERRGQQMEGKAEDVDGFFNKPLNLK